jgi:LDH2 family malate/lactate/ureidoglycolate dehydrogenase
VTYIIGASTYAFQGFFAPVDMSTSNTIVWNTVNAGRAVPVKWLLTANGTPVSDPASFAGLSSYPVACSSGSGSIDDAIDQTATGASGLQDNGGGNWQFNWQTLSSYKNSCRAVVVKFSDGTTSPAANFKFKYDRILTAEDAVDAKLKSRSLRPSRPRR